MVIRLPYGRSLVVSKRSPSKVANSGFVDVRAAGVLTEAPRERPQGHNGSGVASRKAA